jgi:hypothetical protein
MAPFFIFLGSFFILNCFNSINVFFKKIQKNKFFNTLFLNECNSSIKYNFYRHLFFLFKIDCVLLSRN